MRFGALRPLGLRNGQVIPLRASASLGNIPTPASTHVFAALVALPAEAMLRKALIRAGKTP
jgi:hypothetical protein